MAAEANYDIPMSGTLRFDWNLGQNEDGEIQGRIEVLKDGKRVASNIITFRKGLTNFDDDMLEAAVLYTLSRVWGDDFKPRLSKALYLAYYEMRERKGGYVDDGENPEAEMEKLDVD